MESRPPQIGPSHIWSERTSLPARLALGLGSSRAMVHVEGMVPETQPKHSPDSCPWLSWPRIGRLAGPMFNVCPSCGEYRPDREIRGPEQIAVCPCGDVQPFRAAPLFLVGGASGTGKSTVLVPLARQTLPVVPLESDILWRDAFRQRTDEFTETWLRMAKSIGMAGKPVMLFGAGLVVPDNVEDSVERRYFSVVHRLAFVCDAQILAARLRARPAWRGSAEPAMLEQQIGFNRWLQEHGPSEGMTLVDTSTISVGDASKRVLAWVEARLRS